MLQFGMNKLVSAPMEISWVYSFVRFCATEQPQQQANTGSQRGKHDYVSHNLFSLSQGKCSALLKSVMSPILIADS